MKETLSEKVLSHGLIVAIWVIVSLTFHFKMPKPNVQKIQLVKDFLSLLEQLLEEVALSKIVPQHAKMESELVITIILPKSRDRTTST